MKALTYPAEQGLSEWLLASLAPYPAKGQLLQDEAVIHSRDSVLIPTVLHPAHLLA